MQLDEIISGARCQGRELLRMIHLKHLCRLQPDGDAAGGTRGRAPPHAHWSQLRDLQRVPAADHHLQALPVCNSVLHPQRLLRAAFLPLVASVKMLHAVPAERTHSATFPERVLPMAELCRVSRSQVIPDDHTEDNGPTQSVSSFVTVGWPTPATCMPGFVRTRVSVMPSTACHVRCPTHANASHGATQTAVTLCPRRTTRRWRRT